MLEGLPIWRYTARTYRDTIVIVLLNMSTRLDRHLPTIISPPVIAVTAVMTCAVLTVATPLHTSHTIFATLFIPAVLASAWYGGARWGLVSTLLSSAFLVYFLVEPTHSFKIYTAEDTARLCAFVFVGICISFGVAFERRIRDNSVENAERLRTTLESIGDAVTVTDVDGRITMMNAVAERLTGWSVLDAIGEDLFDVFHVVEEKERTEAFHEAKKGHAVPFVIRLPERSVLVARNGSERPIEANVALIKGSSKVLGVVLVFRDVTSQRQRQREAEATAQRLRELAEQRAKLLEQEQAARDAAVAANQMKDQFLAMVSHELRTPLTSIIGWADIAQSRPASDTLNKALNTIERNARFQLQIVEDLLDVSRITAGAFRMERQPVNIAGVLTSVAETLRVALYDKQIALSLNIQPCPTLSVDPNRMQQVFSNLLSNAIKFTRPNGHIALDLKTDGRMLDIRVSDDGQGFAPEFQSRIFQRFQQAQRGAGKQGLGLGLAITRHIVEMHAGTITAHSAGVNKGATFIVNLPIQAEPATAQSA
jgi:PAS domain S-box-containing protein